MATTCHTKFAHDARQVEGFCISYFAALSSLTDEPVGGTHFLVNGFAQRPILTDQRTRRMCCFCNYIRNWLNVQVFSDRDHMPRLLHLQCYMVREPTHLSKSRSRARSSRCCGLPLSQRLGPHMHLSPPRKITMTMTRRQKAIWK